jgi:hypothetical protein
VEVCHSAEALEFEVRDKDHAYAEFIGTVAIPIAGGLLVLSCFDHKYFFKKYFFNLKILRHVRTAN